jgi:hypothetical protein
MCNCYGRYNYAVRLVREKKKHPETDGCRRKCGKKRIEIIGREHGGRSLTAPHH